MAADGKIPCFDIRMKPRAPGFLHRHHDHHEFFFCATGRGQQHTEAGDVPMRAGELYLFPLGQLHIGSARPEDACLGIVLPLYDSVFSAANEGDAEAKATLAALCRHARPGSNRIPLADTGSRRVGAAMRRMVEEQRRQEPGYRAAIKACLQEVLVTVLRDPEAAGLSVGAVRANRGAERIDAVCRFLEEHFREALDVAQVSRLANMGRSAFHDAFRRRTGTTMIAYLQALRVREAQRLLRTTERSVLQVALHSGFGSLSHFYEKFQELAGTNPQAWRSGKA